MLYQRGKEKTWWYRFRFAGRIVHESARTQSKTVARDAARQRRRNLEEVINGLKRRTLPPTFEKASQEWLDLKRPAISPRSVQIEEANLKHLKPVFGSTLLSEITPQNISQYQQRRLAEGASPKTINLEVGTVRAIFKRFRLWANLQPDVKMLRTRDDIGKALSADEEKGLLESCLASRSRSLYPAVTIALCTGMRYSEIRLAKWNQVDFARKTVTVGDSKTDYGQGRTIRLNSRGYHVLSMWAGNFPDREPEHYVFPAEKYGAAGDDFKPCSYATDPTQPIGDWKEAWEAAKERAKVHCRFHDLRHTACTRMLEAGIPLSVVASVLGWSPATTARMAKRYGHIGQAAHDEAVKAMDGAIFEAGVHQNGNQISGEEETVALTN